MTAELILPGVGYDEFVRFLYEVPSQPELKNQSVGYARLSELSNRAKSGSFASTGPSNKSKEWAEHYKALKSYHAKHGNCSVPFGKDTGSLRSWTERQKLHYKEGKLEQGQIDDLRQLDFDFTVKRVSVRKDAPGSTVGASGRLAQGGASARTTSTKEKSSSQLTKTQSKKQKTSPGKSVSTAAKLPNPEFVKLESTKQKTSPSKSASESAKPRAPVVRKSSVASIEDDQMWNKNYEVLAAFHARNGNCAVPFGKETGALRSWTERQKRLYASSRLTQDRTGLLKELDFEF